MLRKLYKDLLGQDFWPVKIYPLLNLYEKYQEQGKADKFFEFLEKISPDYETDQIKELILCEEANSWIIKLISIFIIRVIFVLFSIQTNGQT